MIYSPEAQTRGITPTDIRVTNSKYFQILQEARDQTLEIFSSPEFLKVKKLIPSLRRLSRLFDMEPVDVGLRRPEDVLFDLKGSQESEIQAKELKPLLEKIQMLCSAYYPLAEHKALRSEAIRYFDENELIDIAKFIVDKVVWKTLEINNDTSEQLTNKLGRKIGGNLKNLSIVALRIYKTGRYYDGHFFQESADKDKFDSSNSESLQDQSLAMAYYDRPEDDLGDNYAFDYLKNWGGKTFPTDEAIDNIQTLARTIGFSKLMYLISKMDERSQAAFLTYLGYFGENQRDITNVAKAFGITIDTMRADLWRVSIQLDKLYTYETARSLEKDTHIPIYPQTLAKELIKHKAIKMNKRVLHHDSSRIVLKKIMESQEFPKFLESLTPTERQVLDLALEMDGEKFVFNDLQISEKLKISLKYVSAIITRIRKRIEKSTVKFITQEGRMIRENDAQHKLIIKRQSMEVWCFACLSPIQSVLFLELTQPDENGRYPSISNVSKKNGVDEHIISIIFNKLNNKNILRELNILKNKVIYIKSHPERFRISDLEIADYIFEQIQAGKPLWGATGGIGYTAIARKLNVRDYIVSELLHRVKIEIVMETI